MINRLNQINTIKISLNNNTKGLSLLKERLKLSIIIFIFYGFLSLLGAGCPVRFLTGLTCPGCGMTRAIKAAISFNFSEAFFYHPLFFLGPIIVLLFLFEEYLNKVLLKTAWIIIIISFTITYLIRLFILKSDIVMIDTSSQFMLLFLRIYHMLTNS